MRARLDKMREILMEKFEGRKLDHETLQSIGEAVHSAIDDIGVTLLRERLEPGRDLRVDVEPDPSEPSRMLVSVTPLSKRGEVFMVALRVAEAELRKEKHDPEPHEP